MLELQQRWEAAAADCMELLQSNEALLERRFELYRQRALLMKGFVGLARGVVDVSSSQDDRGRDLGDR